MITRLLAPVVAALLASGVGVVGGLVVADRADPDRPTASLEPGDCLVGELDRWPADIRSVDCADATWRVEGHWWLTDADLPDLAGLEEHCDPDVLFAPTRESWDAGDRTVLCAAVVEERS